MHSHQDHAMELHLIAVVYTECVIEGSVSPSSICTQRRVLER